MRLTPRIASATSLGLLIVLALAPGCASRKKVSSQGQIEPPPTETTPPPPSETTPPPPPSGETGERLSIEDAFFDFDDYSLRQDAKSALERDGKYLEKNSRTNVVIEGHCDERGSVEYNLALGEKRARAAKEYLMSYGVSGNRLTTISYGKERPFDPGHEESAWAKNRRAHIVPK
ncbi:MAG: peptidoglycan-associated lipoprotein Pal [Candidatus Eisenbacteria bacterium]|uniref:Peptidoglycan-associated protein n=1 Tax=Eiseniibacteriota bacterium TaxID=2212470 RepID=A0A538T3Q3_UNCEI|nr:MAG: peptidoglycan-associated lipoprotein Pal [Candidatus Eisenbacteria bacterium]